ncbi:alpha/beta fold hydrolase [Enterococcus wangshanyuanii]|uniref:Hydrolase n=1 Tax=Enterococcus wangshanyuanii TaxID=2005703 RepID=A0ABQ1NSG6_9ENTE|nr:alpha/beta hydrolase [Enterococcus wangshanyuanii]GGC81828.1 hydrolase [Enterococcus wangshanyuanii]
MKREKRVVLTADYSQIYYEICGTGFPLFLLHGNGGSGKYFEKQLPEFSQHFKVITVDSRGHGHSTNQSSILSFDQMAEDLYLIMKQEHIQQADFVGFSDGANVAMVFTKNYPKAVHRLVLNAGNTTVSGVKPFFRALTELEYLLIRLAAVASEKAKNYLPIIQLMRKNIDVSTNDLRRFTVKTLVIVGKYDVIKRVHSIYLAKNIPNASFVLVPSQGHSFAKKNPDLFNQEVLSFLLEK